MWLPASKMTHLFLLETPVARMKLILVMCAPRARLLLLGAAAPPQNAALTSLVVPALTASTETANQRSVESARSVLTTFVNQWNAENVEFAKMIPVRT